MADVDDDPFTFSDFISPQPQPLQNGDVFAHLFFSQPQPGPFPTLSDPAHKPNGPTPSSLFNNKSDSNGWFNSNPNAQIRVSSHSNRVGPNNIFGKFVDFPNNQILPGNGSGLKFDGLHSKSNTVVENQGEEDEDDVWEFKGADFVVLNSLEEKGQSLSFGSKVEVFPVMEMIQHKQAEDFICDCEPSGKILISGVTTTGEKIVYKNSLKFEMQSQHLCPPGHFSISFKLPGPVDPQYLSAHFGMDGVFECVVKKIM